MLTSARPVASGDDEPDGLYIHSVSSRLGVSLAGRGRTRGRRTVSHHPAGDGGFDLQTIRAVRVAEEEQIRETVAA